MSSRASGYTYVQGKDGKKHRVYNTRKTFSGQGKYRVRVSGARVLKGRGGYYDNKVVKWLGKNLPKGTLSGVGSLGGKAIGAMLGNPAAGGAIGALAGSGAAKLLGFGAYSIKKNSILDEGQSPARMHSNSNCTVIRHREYITDVVSSSSANTFLNTSYPLNPGMDVTFPWLSAIAQQYQEYKWLGLVFEFKTLSADAIASSTNTTLGGIIMATDYNSVNPAFPNKQSMDNAEYTTSCKTSESVYHPVECDITQNPMNIMYVRSGAPPANADLRMYDIGLFQQASFGVQGTAVVLGELWVSYEVMLCKPVSTAANAQDILTDHFQLTSVTNSHILGANQTAGVTGSTLGGTITGNVTYNFPPTIQEGTYFIVLNYLGGSSTFAAVTLTLTNCTSLAYNLGDGYGWTMCGNSTVQAMGCGFIRINALGASITFGGSPTLPSSVTAADLWVTQVDSSIGA